MGPRLRSERQRNATALTKLILLSLDTRTRDIRVLTHEPRTEWLESVPDALAGWASLDFHSAGKQLTLMVTTGWV